MLGCILREKKMLEKLGWKGKGSLMLFGGRLGGTKHFGGREGSREGETRKVGWAVVRIMGWGGVSLNGLGEILLSLSGSERRRWPCVWEAKSREQLASCQWGPMENP